MIDRRSMVSGAAALLFAVHPVRAQSKSRRIAYIAERCGPNEFEQPFLRGLRERGLVDGEQVVVDFRTK